MQPTPPRDKLTPRRRHLQARRPTQTPTTTLTTSRRSTRTTETTSTETTQPTPTPAYGSQANTAPTPTIPPPTTPRPTERITNLQTSQPTIYKNYRLHKVQSTTSTSTKPNSRIKSLVNKFENPPLAETAAPMPRNSSFGIS